MADQTAIEWTQATWNPTVGCSLVSPGCTNCYAMKVAHRLQHNPDPNVSGKYAGLTTKVNGRPVWTGEVRLWPPALDGPLKRKRSTTYFVDSESDLFHEGLSDDDIDRVFAVMALCPQHTFQILTKRPARMRSYFQDGRWRWRVADILTHRHREVAIAAALSAATWRHLPNVCLGVSAEDQERADERIPALLAAPAALRFVSCEPLLGPIYLRNMNVQGHPAARALSKIGGYWIDTLTGRNDDMGRPCPDVPALDWVIAGGESGPGARPMHPAWARALRDQCAAANVPFFFKQWGEYAPAPEHAEHPLECEPVEGSRNLIRVSKFADGTMMQQLGKKRAGRELDGRTHDEMPAGLEGTA